MIVGFTGTRKGMNERQSDQLALMLRCFLVADRKEASNELHQGGAVGADREARIIARAAGYTVHWHPCPGVTKGESDRDERPELYVLQLPDDVWHEVFPPLVRNRHIVAAVDVLLAAPRTDTEEQRSGTWATVRYARLKGIPVVMLTRGAR